MFNAVMFQIVSEDNKAIFLLVLDLRYEDSVQKYWNHQVYVNNQHVSLLEIRTPVKWQTVQPPSLTNGAHHQHVSHRPHIAKQG